MKALRTLVFTALLAALPGPLTLHAQGTPAVAMTIRAGYDGYLKENRWLPVRVTVANDGPDVDGVLRIEASRFNGSMITFARPIELPRQSRKEVFMYSTAEGFLNRVQVTLVQGDEVLADATTRVAQLSEGDLLFGVVAGNPSAFQLLADIDPINGQGVFAQLSLADLPPKSAAWDSLDVLVLSDVDTGTLSPAQLSALETWIASGGRLIVAGGPGWLRTLAGVEELVPLRVGDTASLASLQALGTYALTEPPEGSAQVTAGAVDADADVLLAADGEPLIVERNTGYGAVDYLAFDPALAPFNGWSGMENVYRNLLASRSQLPSWTQPIRNWHSGGEAVSAVPGVDLPSTLQMCAFAGAYVFAVGPLNFIILRHLRRREYAWLTIPGLVVLFSGISYLAGFTFRGTRPILHRVSVVQVWEESERAQVEMLVGLFSPRRARYDVQVSGNVLVGPFPANTVSGSVGASIDDSTLEIGDAAIVRDMQVDVGAVKSFVVNGQVAAPRFASDLVYDFGSQVTNVSLWGTVTNLSDLALSDAVLLAPSSTQALGDVGPGEERDVLMTLAAGRAAPGALPGTNQVLPPGAVVAPFAGGGRSGSYDTTIDDILGGSGSSFSYYDDRDTYRRYSLLQWLVDPYSGGARGSGVFLVGWAQRAPLETTILNRPFATADETLFIVNLQPAVTSAAGVIAIPPELMTWELLDPGSGSGDGPYDVYLYEGTYALRFQPQPGLQLGPVQGLTMHLHAYGSSGPAPLLISLREQQSGAWVTLDDVEWGDSAISGPGRFVAADGHIDVRVENVDATGRVSIERLDFTLRVEQ